MQSRLLSRIILGLAALARWVMHEKRKAPHRPSRILIVHHLRLGDTLMLTPFLSKLRQVYPESEIVMTVPVAIAPLYQFKPYGVEALPFDSRDQRMIVGLLKKPGFDIAYVPGDNRFSWLAFAAKSKWIVAFEGDRPSYKSWFVDEFRKLPDYSTSFGEMMATLVDGPPPRPFRFQDWKAPDHRPFDLPSPPYVVLHVGASSSLKRWFSDSWRMVCNYLQSSGMQVVLSVGKGEETLIEEIDPERRCLSFLGTLDLPQMWRLLSEAKLLVSCDTGIAHLGRVVGVPTITLFGPGSSLLYGSDYFWKECPYAALTKDIACRNQQKLFKREIEWVRTCCRNNQECTFSACMAGISAEDVMRAAAELSPRKSP